MAYDVILPSIPVIAGYLLTYSLYRLKIISKSMHTNLWNMIIGISFVISAGAGFILICLLDMGITLPISPELLNWHVEYGITLALVTIFHFHTYWRSSSKMFKISRRRELS
jgi:hypothetical protein